MWLSPVLPVLLPTNQIPYTSCFHYSWRNVLNDAEGNIPQKHLTLSAMWETLTFRPDTPFEGASPGHSIPLRCPPPSAQHPSEVPPFLGCKALLQEAAMQIPSSLHLLWQAEENIHFRKFYYKYVFNSEIKSPYPATERELFSSCMKF